MAAWRTGMLLALLLPTASFGQNYNLSEAPKAGECYRIDIETGLTGSMKVAQDGKVNSIKISAQNTHAVLEKVLTADKGLVRKSARYYEKAVCAAEIGDEKMRRGLRDDRKLFVAQRLAASGYVAVAITYRLAPDHKFPAQIEDCKSAVRWMRTHA